MIFLLQPLVQRLAGYAKKDRSAALIAFRTFHRLGYHILLYYLQRGETAENILQRNKAVIGRRRTLRDYQLDINSPWFVQEMRMLRKDEARQTIAAEIGAHDDRIMSMAWAYLSLHIMETGEFRSPFGISRIAMDLPPVKVSVHTPEWAASAAQSPQAAAHSELSDYGNWAEEPVYSERPPSPLELPEFNENNPLYASYLEYMQWR